MKNTNKFKLERFREKNDTHREEEMDRVIWNYSDEEEDENMWKVEMALMEKKRIKWMVYMKTE